MKQLFRRLRGIIGTGLTWAIGWGVAGTALHFVFSLFGYAGFLASSLMVDVLVPAFMGLLGGSVFAGGLVLTERRGLLGELHLGRAAAWGALAGLVGPVLVAVFGADIVWLGLRDIWPFFLGTGLLGASGGAAMTAIARSGTRPSIEANTDADPAALSGASGSALED